MNYHEQMQMSLNVGERPYKGWKMDKNGYQRPPTNGDEHEPRNDQERAGK